MASLESLRSQLGVIQSSFPREIFPCSLVQPGIPRGAITEIIGSGKTELVIQILAENPQMKAAWVESALSLYPCAIIQRQVTLDRLLFNEAGKEVPWVTLQLLRSQLFHLVIVDTTRFDFTMLRRFQLTTEKSHCGFILLSDHLQSAWPIRMQIHVQRECATDQLITTVVKHP